jgi:hypothetical protein
MSKIVVAGLHMPDYISTFGCKPSYPMERRKFIFIMVAASALAAVPVIRYRCLQTSPGNPLLRPEILACICDEKEICDIGDHYRSRIPAENKKDKLVELILTDDAGKKNASSDDTALYNWIEQKVREDFKEGRIVVVDGWILSETEARQCALLSLAEN